MSWKKVKLGDIADFSNGINFGKDAYGKGIKIIGVSNFGDRFFPEYESLEEVKEEVVRKNDYLISGDMVFVRSNGNKELVGRCMLVDCPLNPVTYSGFCIRARLKDITKHYPPFWTYHFKNVSFRRAMSGAAVGANIQNLSQGRLSTYEAVVPDFHSQVRIANILSPYDHLIENNKKQIKLLEEAVHRLYKEWFIDLHFPGYEEMKIVNGVPEKWNKKTVLECLESYIGGGWGKDSIVGKNTISGKVIRGTDINNIKSGVFNGVPLRYHTENDKNKRALRENDIVFELSNGNIDNIGRSLLIDDYILKNCGDNTICASFCKLLRPLDRIHALLLYLEIQDMQSSGRMMQYKKQGSNGINNFAFDDFLSHELLVTNDYSMLLPIENIRLN